MVKRAKIIPPIHPGETLREDFLKPLGLSANRLAMELLVPVTRINDIVRGKRAITADTALRLARYFGTTPQFWMNLQANYGLEMAQDARGPEIAGRIRPHQAACPGARAGACAPALDCGTQCLRRPLRFSFVARDRRLRGGQAGDGDAERRAGHVVHAHAVAELHRARLAPVLAADADFQVRVGLAAAIDRHLHQLADTFLVEDGEGIVGEDLAILVVLLELRIVVAREAHGGLGQVVGAEAEELGFLGDVAGGERGARNFDHGADHVLEFRHAGLAERFLGNRDHDLLLILEFLDAADQRDHDFGDHLHALLEDLYDRFEDGARLHFGDLGIGDAETAAAVAQHGVELVEFFDALEQVGDDGLEILDLGAELLVLGHQLALLLDIGIGQDGDVHHEVFALGEELVERRIERADDHREAVHGGEEAGEILALHGEELQQGLAAALFVARQNHGLHVLDAVLGEEHVLGAAQSDAFGAELARHFGVARDIGVGAHAELAAEFVGPRHEALQHAGGWVGIQGVGLAGEDFAGGTIERNPVAFTERDHLAVDGDGDFLLMLVDGEGFGAGDAGSAHAAADYGGVAGHAAARGEDALGDFHAVDIVRYGFLADQYDGGRLGGYDGVIGREYDGADRSAGGGGQTLGQEGELLLALGVEYRVEELIELLGIDAQDGFLLAEDAFIDHLDGDANRGGAGALAVAGLQHVERPVLDGELKVLDVAVVIFQGCGDVFELVVDGGVPLFEFGDGVRGTDAGDHVFALRVLQELAVEGLFAGGGIAGEADASGGGFAEVAEHHGLDVDGGAEIVGDLVHFAIMLGAVVKPGAEHGIAGAGKLGEGVLRERFAGLLLH